LSVNFFLEDCQLKSKIGVFQASVLCRTDWDQLPFFFSTVFHYEIASINFIWLDLMPSGVNFHNLRTRWILFKKHSISPTWQFNCKLKPKNVCYSPHLCKIYQNSAKFTKILQNSPKLCAYKNFLTVRSKKSRGKIGIWNRLLMFRSTTDNVELIMSTVCNFDKA